MTRAVTVTAAVLGNLLGFAQSGYWARGRAIVSRVKTFIVTRPAGARAPAPQRMTDRFPARVDPGEGVAPEVVVIPLILLIVAGLLIMVLATFVDTPSVSPSLSSSDADEEVHADLPVIDEIEVGESLAKSAAAGAGRADRADRRRGS